jgi:hypothetical protein
MEKYQILIIPKIQIIRKKSFFYSEYSRPIRKNILKEFKRKFMRKFCPSSLQISWLRLWIYSLP